MPYLYFRVVEIQELGYKNNMDAVQEALRKRYSNIHPLIFFRCLEKARTNGELFDMLDGFPQEYPTIWDEQSKSWIHTTDLLQSQDTQLIKKER